MGARLIVSHTCARSRASTACVHAQRRQCTLSRTSTPLATCPNALSLSYLLIDIAFQLGSRLRTLPNHQIRPSIQASHF
eukprot:5758072-Pleurochrysis_carterae.AAC.1